MDKCPINPALFGRATLVVGGVKFEYGEGGGGGALKPICII